MTPSFRHATVPDSPFARWDARWKLAGILVAVGAIATLNRLLPAAVACAVGLTLLGMARLPWRWLRLRLSLFALASLPFVLVLPFTLDGPAWVLGPVSLSERGLRAGLAVFCRGMAIGALALVLIGTAPVHRTITAAHKLKVPGVLVLLALLAHRYAFVLAEEQRRLRVALRVRGFRASANRRSYRTLGHVAGAVLVRGADRAERVTDAMRCRGFDGRFHTLAAFRTTTADVVSFLLIVAWAATLVLWDRQVIGKPNDPMTIRTSCLSHRFGDGRVALDNVSFSLEAGECVALVGPNGAGKTTLFLRLCGVLPGKSGQVLVAGLDPADPLQRKKLPATVGVVFQNPDDQLFSPTVAEDVAFGPLNLGATPAEARLRVEESLRTVGLMGSGDRVPFQLSGGEKRRAALAGVLAMRPSVLLLDEPSMFLDPRGRRELIGTITGLPGTKLIATHDLDFVLDVCPRVLVLDRGRLVADGTAETLLANREQMEQYGLEVPHRLCR